MDDELQDRITEAAETNALLNAVKHDSEAQVGAIMGPLMGENPEFREYGDEIPGVIAPVVERVNGMDAEERRERLAELAPEKLEELESEDEGEDHPLPDLPSADEYDTVRMRVAPNPNGPWHIGHARMAAVVGTYKERYDGEFICRFDDTDPETKRPDLDAYDAILDAIDYLGFEPDDVVNASDRVETYYEYARELIDKGGAYTCSCPQGEFSDLKNNGEACPHREKDAETTRSEFESMVDGEYDSGEMVLRVRTDITHKNPALRDFVAFRMVDTPHPREEAAEYRCWPMLDFQSGLDDHLLGVTHIIRGIDLQDSAKRQQFVYDYFDWEYPEVIHWGHVQVDAYDVPLSTSSIAELIADGELAGWDDPRAPTVASLERRGIRGEAVVDAMIQLGTSTSNVDLAMSSIYSNNRDRIDDQSDRAFFVRDSDDHGGLVERQIVGGPDAGEPPLHPDFEDRGCREIPVTNGVAVEGDDLPPHGERVWLKGYGCVRHTRDAFEYAGDDIDAVREEGVDVIHWAPTDGPRLRLRTMDGDVSGVAEPGLLGYDTDDVVQFERIGFARLDEVTDEPDAESVAYFTHP
ncbi:glutamyl-tRNA synthetase [Haloarcula vallismortis]|uniref:Glutamate--tRNA ligase n=2 Tax=Haloarcula vallismortis TaxID=28442 RepID=M0JIE0_HALVA|nr:glutamate--tRNA ligase [Haloarcula vallismortis]EMA07759.1 glutamyl-tRNA ligase [Haloarcula vallismortis ATCC 29715]SDW71903.1 glutamyl-tRNA synthetase [Haloarcula vallismortis]